MKRLGINFRAVAQASIFVMAFVVLVGCGRKMSGIYKLDGGGAPFKQLNFTSGSKVELTTLFGATSEASYVVDGEKIKISAGGSTQIFTKDSNGCLDGGGSLGKFCK